MKIKALHIYGFGKLENVKVDDFSPAIQVVYGENEAGKSTIMAFIHAVLFGFPAKNQQDLRYLPKKGYKYGGKLIIETKDQRTISIERVAGKSSGHVTVLDDRGNHCSLDDIMGGLDKTMYKGIFSFNIMDLQNLNLIDADQLGGYLFSSGLIGSDQLQKLSNELNKEQEDLFKPNGRKPEINKLLNRLKEEEKSVQLWKTKIEEYEQLQTEAANYDDLLKDYLLKKEEKTNDIKFVEAMLAIQPLVNQAELLRYQIKEFGDIDTIPVDGLARLEKWQNEAVFYQTKLDKFSKDIVERKRDLEELQVDRGLLQKEEAWKDLSSKRSTYEQAKSQLELLSAEKERLDSQIADWKNELDWSGFQDTAITGVNTSLASKAILKELIKKHHELSIQKQRLDDQFQVTKDELELQEERVASLEKELLPEDEVTRLKKAVTEQGKDGLEKEMHVTEQLLSQINRQLKGQENIIHSKKKKKSISVTASLLFGITAAITLVLFNQYLLALLLFLLVGVLTFISTKQGEPDMLWKELNKEKEEHQSKLEKLRERFFATGVFEKMEANQQALAKEEQVKHLLQKERLLLSQNERAYQKIILQFEEWEKDKFLFEENWKKWAHTTKLVHIAHSFMEEAFEKVIILKGAIVDRKALTERMKHYEQVVKEFDQHVSEMVEDLKWVDKYAPALEIISQVGKELNGQHNMRLRSINLQETISELEEEKANLTVHIKDAQKQIELLFEQAGVGDEDAFRLKNHQHSEKKELDRECSLVVSQLKQLENAYDITLEESKPMDSWITSKDKLESELRALNDHQQQLLEKRTAVYETIRNLEEGGTYSEAVQQLELSKSALQLHARKWAVYATAKHLLTQTMDYYRTVKLPKVLEQATEHFAFLTDGNYIGIHDTQHERKIIVEHKDGSIFEPKELSQATIEQLYISIRFALAQVWSEEQTFPFIMDDSFVNFDQKRADLAIALMNRLARNGNQFIFFTCHQQTKEKISKEVSNSVFSFTDIPAVGMYSTYD